jgi:glycosyltransferase involved in cell wall biosynthesis
VQKRPDRLIELARLLPHVRFVVCGSTTTFMTPEGYGDRAIEAFRTLPNIDYRGQVSPEEALRVSRESALLLSTSQEEGFPQTFLEAWSYGTPVVTLGINPGDVITTHELGVVEPDAVRAAAAIDALMAGADVRDRIGQQARQYVADVHSPLAAVRALERLIEGRNGALATHARRSPVVPKV